jgi:hypothetical protein
MEISIAVTRYIQGTPYKNWDLKDCLHFVAKNCLNLTSEFKQEVINDLKREFDLTSKHQSICQKGRNKAAKLCKDVDRLFASKDVITFFEELDVKVKS